jgi:acyl-CoA oxidase
MKDANKRFGISLGALSNGRTGLTHYAACFMNMALTTAIRYAAVRKQFGPSLGNEIPILEYQLHVSAVCLSQKYVSLSLLK